MTAIRTHRDLIAWQLGMRLARAIYQISQRMPKSEQFGLTHQMRRAVVSVPSNIAEGYARQSTADYLRCLRIARGSLAEVATQFELSIDLKMLGPAKAVTDLLAETDRVLQGLIRGIEKKT